MEKFNLREFLKENRTGVFAENGLDENIMVFFQEKENFMKKIGLTLSEINSQMKRSQYLKNSPEVMEEAQNSINALNSLLQALNKYKGTETS